MTKPNCYKCKHMENISCNAHKSCKNRDANVKGNPHGIKNGWFIWPHNFDPVWLKECDGFNKREGNK